MHNETFNGQGNTCNTIILQHTTVWCCLCLLFPNGPNNSCGCSLMCGDIVEQSPGDICGDSFGAPPPPGPIHSPHTLVSSSTVPGHCFCQGLPMWDVFLSPQKELVFVPLIERWMPFLFFLPHFIDSHRRGRKEAGETTARTAILHAVAFHHTTNSPYLFSTTSAIHSNPSRERMSERGETRGGPWPCDTQSMWAQLHPQAEWTGACCVSPAWLIWLRGRRTATALPALTPYSPGLHEHTHQQLTNSQNQVNVDIEEYGTEVD